MIVLQTTQNLINIDNFTDSGTLDGLLDNEITPDELLSLDEINDVIAQLEDDLMIEGF